MAFRLNCISELYKNLGRYDAIVEFTEISIRDFIEQARISGDFDKYLQQKSIQHGIRVNSIDKTIYRARISQSYILSVNQTAELFLHQFRDEHIELYNAPWKIDDSTESLLTKTIRKITKINKANLHFGNHRLSVYNYYRLVRNKYSHSRISDSKLDLEYQSVKKFIDEIQHDYPGLNAPNSFDKISFDDFILFSRIVKDIADKLNDLVKPTNEQIKDYYLRKDLFKKLNENVIRKKNALKGHMLSNFGIEESQANEILNLLHFPLA